MTTAPPLVRPKILPWIAHRYALSLDDVEALWQQAMLMADLRHGRDHVGPEYWRDSVETFLRRAGEEGVAPEVARAAATGPVTAKDVLEAQDRVRRRTLSMLERMMRAGTSVLLRRRPRARRRPEVRH